jgi:hypothetical protein
MLHPLRLSLQFARLATPGPHRAALPRQSVARWIRHALAREAEITVRIVDEAEGLALNADYRKQDHATNVLTFDYSREPVVCADLVLCALRSEQMSLPWKWEFPGGKLELNELLFYQKNDLYSHHHLHHFHPQRYYHQQCSYHYYYW